MLTKELAIQSRSTGTRIASSLLLGFVLALVIPVRTGGAAELRLVNGWTNAPFSTSAAEAFVDEGIVHLKGAVGLGTDPEIVPSLQASLRPATQVYVAINLCNAEPGRLVIEPTGRITVQPSGTFEAAQCFTSLDGAKYARDASGFTSLTLINGWTNAPFSTSNAAARVIAGIVYLKGAVANGSAEGLFTLPLAMRPATSVFVPINLCDAKKGRLWIQPSGLVSVLTGTTSLADAQCFTSLDGVSFAPTAAGFTNLALENGWTNAPFSTSNAAAVMFDGIVRFKGAVSSGTAALLFQLPSAMRPSSDVYVGIDLCGSAPGRLLIQSNGNVSVQEPPDSGFTTIARCFTSLDGASFVPAAPEGFADLTLVDGWVNSIYGTQTPAVALYDGIVHFKGAISGGATDHPFKLPVTLRPEARTYVAVDMFEARAGRLIIDPDTGLTTVESADGLFSTATGFVSLEGASYDKSATGIPVTVPLTLVNGWAPTIFDTAVPGAARINGLVHLQGAVSSGSTNPIFTLLPTLRPANDVYVSVGLCGAEKGRLRIQPSGEVSVLSTTSFADAQCFTSLDGVRFAPSDAGFAPLTLLNGWTTASFGNAGPSVTIQRDIVHFRGAIWNGTSENLFVLPPVLRPQGNVYTPVDLCDGKKGRLLITPGGAVSVQVPDAFGDAQCFTSLDGASYAVPEPTGPAALLTGLLLLAGIRSERARRAQPRAECGGVA